MSAGGPLHPNAEAMHGFLSFWFHDCTAGCVELGSLIPGTTQLSVFERFGLDQLEEAAEYAARTNARPGASIYFRASTIAPEARQGRTTDADMRQAPGLWTDHDSEASVAALAANPLPFKPPAWIITGTTPHMRVQAFWRLSEPLTNSDMVRDLNKRLISVFKCDPTTYNPSRLMRLPGSIAWPVKAGRSIAELTTWAKGDNRPSALPVHQVAFSLPQATPQPASTTQSAAAADDIDWGSHTPGQVSGMIEKARTPPNPGEGGHWHDTVLRLVAHWVGRGFSTAEIMAMAEHLTAPGYNVSQTRAELRALIDSARKKWGVEDQDRKVTDEAPATKTTIWHDSTAWNEAEIPPRPWVVKGYFMRGSVSVLSGQGAGGKSSLVVRWTCALALGESVGEFHPNSPSVVVNYNVEDDAFEQQRRYSATLKSIGKKPEDIAGKVIRCGPSDIGTLFERQADTGRIVQTGAMEALERLLMESGADVLVCDPLAELHNAEENDNTAMRAVIAAFRGMAQRLGIAIMILHHDRKGTNAPGDMDRMRGASAITGAVRVMLTLTTMSQEEADKFGIAPEDRRRHFRIDGAKSNYAIAQDAEWWKLSGIEIGNGEEIAASAPWSPPSPFGGLSVADCVAILDAIHAGTPAGHAWGATKQAGADWAGRLLMAEPYSRTERQAADIIGLWLKDEAISIEELEGPRRGHPRKAFVVNLATVAEMRRQKSGVSP